MMGIIKDRWIKDSKSKPCPGCGRWILVPDYKEYPEGPLYHYKLKDYCKECVTTMRQMIASDVRKPVPKTPSDEYRLCYHGENENECCF